MSSNTDILTLFSSDADKAVDQIIEDSKRLHIVVNGTGTEQAGIYKSVGTQGAYSLFRNLATSSSSTVYTDVDQAILDDGGIDYVVEGYGDQFTALVTNGGHIFWCGRGYTGTQWPAPFRVASAYNGRLDDENSFPQSNKKGTQSGAFSFYLKNLPCSSFLLAAATSAASSEVSYRPK